MKRFFLHCVISILVVVSLAFSTARGQSNQSTQGTSTDTGSGKVTSLSGEIGIIGELYSIAGRDNRRPSSTGRLFFRPTITILNSIVIDFDFLLSTEGNSSRQDINQFDINPKWSWGEMHAGDFTHHYTPLTLSGIKIRGGGIMLHPGKIRISFLSGITRRAVSSQEYRSYKRVITAGSFGVGSRDGSSFDLTVMTACDRGMLDDVGSDSIFVDTTIDISTSDSLMDPKTVTPQENLVVSLSSQLLFFDRKVRLTSEISGCAVTRDRRSSEYDTEDVPDFLASLFVPRISSSADFAIHTKAAAHFSNIKADLGYEYTGPGYVSLGLPSLQNDRRSISTGISYQHRQYSVWFKSILSRDNLIDQKSHTTNRNRFSLTATLRPVRVWNCLVAVNLATLKNNALGSQETDYRNWIVRTSQTLTIRQSRYFKNAAIDYTLQTADEANPARQSAEITSHTIGIRSLINATDRVDITPSIRVNIVKPAVGNQRTMTTYALNTRVLFLQNKLQNNGMISLTKTAQANTVQVNVESIYQYTKSFRISGELHTNFYRTSTPDPEFDEITFRLNVVRSF